MKIYRTTPNEEKDYEKFLGTLEVGDIEITHKNIRLTLHCDSDCAISENEVKKLKAFNGDVGSNAVNKLNIYFEKITDKVEVVANTKTARKIYKDKIWKKNEDYLVVKK